MLDADEEGSRRDTPGSSVRASESGQLKKKRAHGVDGLPPQTSGGPRKSLATLCQNRIRLGEKGPLYTRATRPITLPARAFQLIGVAVA